MKPHARPSSIAVGDTIGRIDRARIFPVPAALVAAFAATAVGAQNAPDRSAARTDALEEVIVTAERLGRSLMETSTSVVVLDAAALELRPLIEGTNDLLGRIPNVTSTGTTNFAPAVRGIDGTGPAQGFDAAIAGTRSRLNVQLDGRPATYNEIVFGDMGIWDVEQVEILRGPQSALQGRNAIAGTLAIKTKDPTYDTEARARVFGGNMQTRQYSAAFSAPIIEDQLAFRLAADRRTSESFVEDFTPHMGTDNPGEFETSTYRGKLLFEPKAIEGFSALFTMNYSESRGPQSEDVAEPFDDEYLSSFPPMPIMVPRTTAGVLDLNWESSESLAFQTRMGLSDSKFTRRAQDGTGVVDARELFVEPLVHFNGARVSGLGGLYFFDADQSDVLQFTNSLPGRFDDSTRTTAVFGEATYALTESFDVTVGARYEEEERLRNGALSIFTANLDETYKTFLPKLVLSWQPTDTLTVGTLVARGYNGGGAGITFDPPFVTYTFDPEYVLNYEIFFRASLAGGKVALTGNVFHSDYEDLQLPFIIGGLSSIIRNAEEAVTYGGELGAMWQVVPGLQLSAGLGVLETEVKKFPDSGFEGHELLNAPAVTGDVAVIYQRDGLEFSLDARYSGAYFSDIENALNRRTDPYWVANAQLGYTFGRVRAFGVVNNIFDGDDRIYRYPPFLDAGILFPASANILRPRTYGVGVQVDF